jgi:hypothetical protein
VLCACAGTAEIDGDAQHVDAAVVHADASADVEIEAPVHTDGPTASTEPGESCSCEGEYLVDNALLACDPSVDGSRLTLTCEDDGGVTVEIDGLLLRGEHHGDGAFAAVGEDGCRTMVMEGTLPDCRIRADWTAVGCDCPETFPIYAVPVP